jgi:hypothetical protein
MKPGSIVLVTYIVRKPIKIQDEQKDRIQLDHSSMYIQKFLMDMTFNPGAAADPNMLFANSRKDAFKIIDEFEQGQQIFRKVYLQAGQKESIEEIKQIESDPLFVQWQDSYIIDAIKNI